MIKNTASKFHVIEGLDGVGKTTLTLGLAACKNGVALSTPGSEFNNIRADIIRELNEDQLGCALFYCATVSSQGKKAKAIANSGHTVFMDRYWPSTLAYAKARGMVTDLSFLENDIVSPDSIVLITLDENERFERLRTRGMTEEDTETLNTNFRERVLYELESRCTHEVDITGLTEDEAVERVAKTLCID